MFVGRFPWIYIAPTRFGQAHTRERSREQEKALVNFPTVDTLRPTICCSILGERIKTVEELSGNETERDSMASSPKLEEVRELARKLA